MCLREPRFLVAWNIHVSCNLSCATDGIAMHGTIEWNTDGMAMHAIAMHGIRPINMHYSPAINLQNHFKFSPQQ